MLEEVARTFAGAFYRPVPVSGPSINITSFNLSYPVRKMQNVETNSQIRKKYISIWVPEFTAFNQADSH